MASLMDVLRGRSRAAVPEVALESAPTAPEWFQAVFADRLVPQLRNSCGDVLVWTIADDATQATITDQFKANAAEYHRRYAASDHFERLFRQAIEATGLAVAPQPRILDLGSGSGVNSIVPCRRLFPGARMVATDLSGELLAMLADYLASEGAAHDVACVKMDAMGEHVAAGAFDFVTGASILHHLESPEQGLAAAGRALRPGGHAIFFEPFNGWAIVRLAFERILAEAELRGDPLDPAADKAVRALIVDVEARSAPTPGSALLKQMDDKWLFSRTWIEQWAAKAGFADVRFVPHKDHPTLYRDLALVHLRLSTGRADTPLPDWALAILDSFDAAFTQQAKRELMAEGSIVLTKG
jgi:SAM-dependent methyltransferase